MARAFDPGFSPGFGHPNALGTLFLKIGTTAPDPAYQDGDIVTAVNRRRCREVHAQHICHPRAAARNSDGLIPLTHLSQDWFEATHQYRFERVSATQILQTNLLTTDATLIGPTPNAEGQYIDVRMYLARRKQIPENVLFGTSGAEVWYGGRKNTSHAVLDTVWNAIETKTAFREINHMLWPAGTEELKHFLLIHVDDFDEATSTSLTESEIDETDPDNIIVVRKRRRRIPWQSLPGMSAARMAQVQDQTVPVDIRAERKHPRAPYLVVKA